MITLVLPYIKSAKEGAARLGALIEKYGTGESNSIAFNDQNDVWYLETAGGHHWAAMRLPEDTYAIAPNQTLMQTVDLQDTDNFLVASDLVDFVAQHHLNPTPDTFNFREIFGTHGEDDAYYNTPRTWYGQKLFNPEITDQQPTDQDMPFTRKPAKKLAIEDVQFFLSSHYNGTPYDPLALMPQGQQPISVSTGRLLWIVTNVRRFFKLEMTFPPIMRPFSGLRWASLHTRHMCHSLPTLQTRQLTIKARQRQLMWPMFIG